MPIPDYQPFMLPLLKYASDYKAHKKSDAAKTVDNFGKVETILRIW